MGVEEGPVQRDLRGSEAASQAGLGGTGVAGGRQDPAGIEAPLGSTVPHFCTTFLQRTP